MGVVFALSVAATFLLYASVSGGSFGSVLGAGWLEGEHSCACASAYPCTHRGQWYTRVGGEAPVLHYKPKVTRRMHLLGVKRFIQRFS